MIEIWKDIDDPRYAGRIQVSNHGRVKRLEYIREYEGGNQIKRFTTKKTFPEVILKQSIKPNTGYYQVKFRDNDNIAVSPHVHRLIALGFVEKPDDWEYINDNCGNGYTVNHKDGNKLNNSSDNLEWLTTKDNIRHAINEGLYHRNEHSKKIVYVWKEDKDGNNIEHYKFESAAEAERQLNLPIGGVSATARGEYTQTGGYKASYEGVMLP